MQKILKSQFENQTFVDAWRWSIWLPGIGCVI